ncbi:MAG: hypothetical protein M3P08_08035 [Thermoproteota archaeon]|jgi:hypothetical protein|nr:hypothetical protein [Thermoproteota archaeon]
MLTGQLKREPKLAFSDGRQTQYGVYIKEVNKAYENLGYIGSSLRYYYYLLASKGFIPDAKNASQTFSKVTMIARDFGSVQQYFDEDIYQEQLKLQEKERRKIRGQ